MTGAPQGGHGRGRGAGRGEAASATADSFHRAHQKLIFGQEFMLHRHRVNGMWVACGPRDLGHEPATDRDDRTPQRAQWWRRRRLTARCVGAAYAAAYAHW